MLGWKISILDSQQVMLKERHHLYLRSLGCQVDIPLSFVVVAAELKLLALPLPGSGKSSSTDHAGRSVEGRLLRS
jgi:hypothetical protein